VVESAISYFEDLDVGCTCPHEDAFVPDGEKEYFRVLKSSDVTSDCFLPTPIRADRPLPDGFDDCIGKSVSIYDDLQGMINGFFKIQAKKNKKKQIGVCVLKLGAEDGLLKQTFGKNHHSWWRSQAFDVTAVTVQKIVV
jgi:hypothetical protein